MIPYKSLHFKGHRRFLGFRQTYWALRGLATIILKHPRKKKKSSNLLIHPSPGSPKFPAVIFLLAFHLLVCTETLLPEGEDLLALTAPVRLLDWPP